MQIDYLANHQHFIPTLARWTYEEWGHLRPGDSIERRIQRLQNDSGHSRIPTVFVAFEGSDLLGSAKLVVSDMETRADLSPWLAGVLVAPPYRGRGIGANLVRRVMEEARVLSVPRLYLFTPSAAQFYARLQWSLFEQTNYLGIDVTVMCHDFTKPSPGK
jgi:GNAT superfamily N-acetyltransferase